MGSGDGYGDPKKSDFEDRVSSGYVGWVDSRFSGYHFRFFGFGRVYRERKKQSISWGYNGTTYLVLLSSKRVRGCLVQRNETREMEMDSISHVW